ncbi:MAG: serine protease [Polyangia bacterium]
MAWAERKQIISEIEHVRGSRVICYVTSDRPNANVFISTDASPIFHDFLSEIGPTDKIDLFLYTQGGDTLAAFGICRLLREYCKRLGVLIPFRCHSAGTLIALGADEVTMTRGGTLSPIDPSVAGPLNPAVEVGPGQRQLVPLSVEQVAGFMDLVKKDWGIDGDALGDAFKALAEKVHPLALGNVYRARQQIELLAKTLLRAVRSGGDDEIGKIVSTFARDLGSHDFPITRSSARDILGSQVAADNPDLEALIWRLYQDYAKEMRLREPFDPSLLLAGQGGTRQVKTTLLLAMIETVSAGDAAERELQLTSVTTPMGPGVQQEIVRAGWRHYT